MNAGRGRPEDLLARRGGAVELLWAPALLLGGLTALRNRLYDRGWLPSERVPVPVVGVGNLSAGGTGKTPMVAWLARWFEARGLRPGIASRGYRRHRRTRAAGGPPPPASRSTSTASAATPTPSSTMPGGGRRGGGLAVVAGGEMDGGDSVIGRDGRAARGDF